ncbi:hypothetical protein Btru_076829 [Bulinus truncatus]|nr:hypothetical protein Btru_076829 [Bulinus truncatus]
MKPSSGLQVELNTTSGSSDERANFTATLSYRKYLANLTDNSKYDRYLKVILGSQHGCQEADSYDAIMAVHTAPSNEAKRQAFRWLYTDSQKTYPYTLKVIFFIGLVKNAKLHSQLVNESQQFGDLVQGNFVDSYKNLTYKTIFVYKWVSDHCRGLKLMLRTDDDVYLDVQHFFKAWGRLVSTDETNTLMCDVVHQDVVWRKGKWAVQREEIAEDKYQFQHCRGYFAALTSDLPGKMVESARRTPFFWIDDVFMYGFVAAKVGVTFFSVDREMARWNEGKFTKCYQTQGRDCSLLSVLATPDKFRHLYSITHNNRSMSIGNGSRLVTSAIR